MNLALQIVFTSFSLHISLLASQQLNNERSPNSPSSLNSQSSVQSEISPRRSINEPSNNLASNHIARFRCLMNCIFMISTIGGLALSSQLSSQNSNKPPHCTSTIFNQTCLSPENSINIQNMCWEADVTMQGNTNNNQTIRHRCLCPIESINSSSELILWASTNLLAASSPEQSNNFSVCIRSSFKPCIPLNACSDINKKSLYFNPHNSSIKSTKQQRTIKHLLKQPVKKSKNRAK